MTGQPHIMLFDLLSGGHHGQYVRQLVEHRGRHRRAVRLSVVAPPLFFERHGDVAEAAAHSGASCVPIGESIGTGGPIAHGRFLRQYVRQLRPTHAVCLYFDQVQLSLAFGLRFDYSVSLSGIYFRPTFHYEDAPTTWERVTRWRKRVLLRMALRNPHVSTLFCLDPYVLGVCPRLRAQLVALPDGAPLCRKLPAPLRASWGVERGRRVALLFGSISARKGIYPLLDALPMLTPAHQRRLAVVMVGNAARGEVNRLARHLAKTRTVTGVQLIRDDRFIGEEEIPDVFHSADLVLMPYQRHVGSSGVLVRAAQAGIPVVGQAYGLVGRHIRKYGLGTVVEASRPANIAKALGLWLEGGHHFFDADRARAFGMANTADHFCRTIFDTLLGPVLA